MRSLVRLPPGIPVKTGKIVDPAMLSVSIIDMRMSATAIHSSGIGRPAVVLDRSTDANECRVASISHLQDLPTKNETSNHLNFN